MILVPLFDLKFLNEPRRDCCRNFKSAALVRSMAPRSERSTPDVAALARGIRDGERAVLARAITLIESKRADHQKAARTLVQALLPATGKAVRVGITGMPGVGKSTTIDALGTFLTEKGHKVA